MEPVLTQFIPEMVTDFNCGEYGNRLINRTSEMTGSPRFLDNPNAFMPCSATPTGPKHKCRYASRRCFPCPNGGGSHDAPFSGLNHTAYIFSVHDSLKRLLQRAPQRSVHAGDTLGWPGLNDRSAAMRCFRDRLCICLNFPCLASRTVGPTQSTWFTPALSI
jgi:hypothetical protein